jgi:uncharacterized protein YutE (UPF0331/DUF86 family)
MGIENYDCRNAYIKVDTIDYIEYLEKAEKTFAQAKKLEDLGLKSLLFSLGVESLGNALLVKLYGIRSKCKNCQFQYLLEKGIINKEILSKLSGTTQNRNEIYYNYQSFLDEETLKENFENLQFLKIFFLNLIKN